ncbi:helix-turn-helix transcriptional regulator [Nocardia miyunensis]|uniref:helix-turn-helix transcriptional regulator n=1 Tax=Nocardia miyunensis TaxID=282684 RepID=UPI000A048D8A|nr:helix-turn-helix transcriptional regulator [Nocardia miyunensis]
MTTARVDRADDLGPALREVRVADGVTQSALAELAGVGRQWLNSFEMGDKPSAPLDMVMRVAAALDVTLMLTPPERFRTGAHESIDDEPIDLEAHLEKYNR